MLVDLESSLYVLLRTKTNAGVPTAATGSPTFAVYTPGTSTPLIAGTLTGNVNSVASLYVTSAIACTTANGFAVGNYRIEFDYVVSGVSLADKQDFTVV